MYDQRHDDSNRMHQQRRTQVYLRSIAFDEDDEPISEALKKGVKRYFENVEKHNLKGEIKDAIKDASEKKASYFFRLPESMVLKKWELISRILCEDYGIGKQSGDTKVPYGPEEINKVGEINEGILEVTQFENAPTDEKSAEAPAKQENTGTTTLNAAKATEEPGTETQQTQAGEKGKNLLAGRNELLRHYYAYKKSAEQYDKYKYVRYQEQNLAKYSIEKQKNLDLLTQSMKGNGFGSMGELEAYIHNYEKTFEKRTLAIAEESLKNYSKQLNAEAEKLNDEAYLTKLYNQLLQSGAKEQYRQASENRQAASSITRDLGGYAAGDATLKGDLNRKAASHEAAGRAAVRSMDSPLMKEEQFKTEKLAQVKSKAELKEFLQDYINDKLESIADTREDLQENPERIYELDKLIAVSKKAQNITSAHPLEQIIQHKTEALGDEKIFSAICFTVVAAALTALSFGGGALLLLGGLASAGLSAYGVFEALEDYKQKNAANDVGLLSEDPSLAWVMLAIAGAAADVAALNTAFKSAGLIAKSSKEFNKSKDLTLLKQQLEKIQGLDARIKENITRRAKILKQEEAILKSLAQAGRMYASIPGLHQTGELLARAYFAVRKGILIADNFIIELKAEKLINEMGLSKNDLLLVHETFEKAKSLGKNETLIVEIEKAVEKADYEHVNKLLKEAEEFLGINWSPKSEKTFGHSFTKHVRKNIKGLTDRAKGEKTPQGIWLDEEKAADLIKQSWSNFVVGENIINIPPGIGNVILPDGTIVENVLKAVVVKNPQGATNLIKTAYPKIIQ